MLLIVISVITDIKFGKIKNYICIPFAVLGIIVNITNISQALLGIIIPIILLYLLFRFKGLGGGDIKLFAAIGAINGADFIFSCVLYSFVFGGAIGIILLLIKKIKGVNRASKTYFIFSPAILLGTIYAYLFILFI